MIGRKFFVLWAFLTIVTTMPFMLLYYRLLHNIQMVLMYKFKTELSLNYVKVEFQNLEERNLRLAIDRYWIRSQLQQLQQFIQKAEVITCPGLEKQPAVASQLKIENEMEIQKSTDDAESSEDQPRPFC
ncbi:hypothetical protein AVEN_242242-1 [Araneus ventricosus]|uniref:Uncharacterized protein n=1 Tax=Araneus ventricosus TaxID=182803 RepID=A0A4Y2RN22_ARAVE|nr:hypothetical protein AVEN_242242-1 [Araneus ventricosus]